ncbi:MAG: inorganic phosphate transporter [Elusimicrobiota bacterium]
MPLSFLIVAIIAGFYMAWNIGANDSANSMAPAVGSKAITFKQAVIIAGLLEFVGAYFVGSHVTETIRKGIISPAGFASMEVFAFALLAAIVGASLWVFIATWKEMPVSTTHSIVGALIGVGIVAGGLSVVSWGKVISIVMSWVISPLFSGVMAFFLFKIINSCFIVPEDREARTKKYFPIFVFMTFFIIVLSFIFKTPFGRKLDLEIFQVFMYASLSALFLSIILSVIMYRNARSFEPEEVFRMLQILTACYVAFAHGANDVANAVGPLAGIYSIYKTGDIGATAEVPGIILALGGVGISIGIFTWGYKVIKTVGHGITELTNTRGFAICFSAATAVLVASKMGLPVSTTHSAVGAVMGIGLARGLEAIDLRVIRKIASAWIFTLPVAAVFSGIIFIIIQAIF